MAGMGLDGKRDIVERGEFGKQRGDLERAGKPDLAAPIDRQRRDVMSVEADAAAVGRDLAGQLPDQRGLAGAIGSDERVQFAARQRERYRVGGHHAAEALGQGIDFEQDLSHGAPRRAIRRCRR